MPPEDLPSPNVKNTQKIEKLAQFLLESTYHRHHSQTPIDYPFCVIVVIRIVTVMKSLVEVLTLGPFRGL